MLRINDIIFSSDVFEKKFKCDLSVCQGICCLYGDSGAPLSTEEVHILDDIWQVVKAYLRPEGIKAIEEQGTSVIDFDNDNVTTLINNLECAYTILEGNILRCGIEKAWADRKISFQKPVSCHLFPVRIELFSDFKAVNYEEIAICSSACKRGLKEGIYVYEFLKEPLIRAFGEKIYREICIAAEELRRKE
jgi:hypothetical protein